MHSTKQIKLSKTAIIAGIIIIYIMKICILQFLFLNEQTIVYLSTIVIQ